MNLRAKVGFLVLAAGAVVLGFVGCDSTNDTVHNRFAPDLIAATAADSVAAGSPLDIKVHWRSTGSCQQFEGFTFNASGDSVFTLVAVVLETRDPNVACTTRDTILEGRFRLNDPPAKPFRVEVFGASQRFSLDVRGGVAPAALERYQVHVTNVAGGGDVEGAIARVIDLATLDTVGVLTTDVSGTAELARACVGPGRAYKLWVTGASGRQAVLVSREFPEACGIPERTAIRL